MLIKLKRFLVLVALLTIVTLSSSAPKTWPYMKTYDIWETNKTVDAFDDRRSANSHSHLNSNFLEPLVENKNHRRKAKGESTHFDGPESD